MSLTQQISEMIGTTEPQWLAAKIQMVNWGGFHGYASATFAPEVTVISGQSGAGKSTLLDAYIALMMPPNVAFNGASNDSGGGRARSSEQRNLLSYLRGKLDDTLEDGEVVDDVMRGRGEPVWGAVAMTFVNDSGEHFTAMRAYFVPTRATRATETTIRPMVIDDVFDLRDLKAFAKLGENHFPPRELRAKWTQLRTFDSYSSFSQALFVKLGIGTGGDGTNALRLLARIQASEDIPTVDRLYKELVIERPDSYEKADAAIEHFDRLEDVYQEMMTAQARADLLEPIIGAHEALVRAQEAIDSGDELGALEVDNTPAGLWRLTRHSEILRSAVDANRAEARETRAKVTALMESEQSLKLQHEAAKKAHSEAGGDLLTELAQQIDLVEARIQKREERRARLVKATSVLQSPMGTQAEFEQLQQTGRAVVADHSAAAERLAKKRDEVKKSSWPLSNRLSEIRGELKSFESRAGRVDPYLDDMRRAVAEASGLPASDLPFVAELIDVMPDEEFWRTAIETALHASARLMLVPLEHLERFSAAIDKLRLKGRLNFEGVERSADQRQPIFEPDRVAGKLLFKESPYQGSVTQHVGNSSRNALCVAGPEGLHGEGLRITPAGQTRRGRGGSHGRNFTRNVIGFDNADLREELLRERNSVSQQLQAIDSEAAKIAAEASNLTLMREAYARIIDETWLDIDVASAVAEKKEFVRRREEIRDNNDTLATLDAQIEQLNEALEGVQRDRHLLGGQLAELDRIYGEYVDREDEVNPVIARIENDGKLVLRQELAHELDRLWTEVLDGEQESPATFARHLTRLVRKLQGRADSARAEVAEKTKQIEAIFRRYLREWENSNLGEGIEFYDDYAAILEEIVQSGLHKQRSEWRRRLMMWSGDDLQQLVTAMSSAIEDIEDRLDPINQILKDLPFGATNDRLFIDLRRVQLDVVVKFRKELNQHSRIATAGLQEEELEKRFKDLQRFMAQIRRKDDVRLPRELMNVVDRDRLLDVRRHVEITAQRRSTDGGVLSVYSSLRGKSGGEMQELIAFIVGSALRFQLGDQLRSRPRFAPVFLDEGFIKADGQFTSRAVAAWRGLGFQLIIGAPIDKAPALEPHADVIIEIAKNLETHRSYVLEMRGLGENVESPAGVGAAGVSA